MPQNVNIRGNDKADTAANSALSLPITSMKCGARELIHRITELYIRMSDTIYGTIVVTVIKFAQHYYRTHSKIFQIMIPYLFLHVVLKNCKYTIPEHTITKSTGPR